MVCPPIRGDNPRGDDIRAVNLFKGKVQSKTTTNQIKDTAQEATRAFWRLSWKIKNRCLNLPIISYRSYLLHCYTLV